MRDSDTTIHSIARQIRDAVSSSVLEEGPSISELAGQLLSWVDRPQTVQRGDVAPLGQAQLDLYAIANGSSDILVVQSCLQTLVRSNRFGRILASRFIAGKGTSLQKLSPKIAAWPAEDRLALAHEMLRDFPGSNDRETLDWLESLLKPLMAADPKELAPFVVSLGENHEHLAFPVRQAITSGLFGRWLTTLLANGSSRSETRQLSAIIIALNDGTYAEALAKAIDLGKTKPTRHALHAIAETGEAGNKTIIGMLLRTLSHTSNGLAGACLDAIIAQEHPGAGKLLASMRQRMPGLRQTAITRAPLLGETGYAQFLKALPEEESLAVQQEMFSVLGMIAPDFVRNATSEGADQRSITISQPPEQAKAQDTPTETTESNPEGFFSRIFKSKPKTLESLLPKYHNIRDASLPNSQVEDEELTGREFSGLELTDSIFLRTAFNRAKLASSQLDGASLSNCQVSDTSFTNVDFTNAQIAESTFANCSFNDCRFPGAQFADCTFRNCTFRGCSLTDTSFNGTKIRATSVTASSAAGCIFHECNVRTTRFEAVDLTYATFSGSLFRGIEFIDSTLHLIQMRGSTFTCAEMPGTTVTRSIIRNSDAPHALFLANRLRQLPVFVRELAQHHLPPPSEGDHFLAHKTLDLWAKELSYMRRERRMLDHNRRRLVRAVTTMGRDQHIFLRILPQLLDSDGFEARFGLQGIPSCRVWEYYPGLTSLELFKSYFGERPSRLDAPDVRILAVYAMGSVGTVAQTPSSDLDCWVCYDGDLTMEMEAGLKRKLEDISAWADNEFNLEAHFYPMRMDDVRDNRFLSGDEESSGSAQALLLKEEFYRTALRLAGKHLAWWITPAGASRKTYDACVRAARRYPLSGKPRLEDFGHLAPVPPDEYFGGALWQMVKAVHAPFKSVLKLGLMETYAAPGSSALPLCDRIKRNLVANRQGKLDTDPYTALFTTLHDYYLKRKELNAAALLRESFKIKVNLSDMPFFMNLPTRPEDESLISVLFGPGYVEPDRIAGGSRQWAFEKSLRMGASVRQYMVNTYQRIQSGPSAKGRTKALINAEDLTRMGRRIAANFSRKQFKIMRVPFMDTTGYSFPILHFSAEKLPGKPAVWTIRGGSRQETKQSADQLQLLYRSKDPAQLFAWLLANRIYHPKSLLQADRSIAPMAATDLQKAMRALYDFFPFAETFERDINEGLQPEQVTRAFFILNLLAPTDTKIIDQATVIYTTNWGEMFCRTFVRPGQILETNPSLFLERKLDQPVPTPPQMALFTPKGAQCKRISLI